MKFILIILFCISLYAQKAPLYIKTIIGRPNMVYFKEEMIVAKEFGINLKYIFKGCNIMGQNKYIVNEKNKNADAYYKLLLGKDWKTKLEEKTKDRINMH